MIAFTFIFNKIHFPQRVYDLANSIPVVQFFLQISVKDERDKTRNEMCNDTFLPFEIYRACLKLALHDAEAFLDLPSALVHLYDGFRPIIQTRAYGIKTVEPFFLGDGIFVDVINDMFCNFPIFCGMFCLDEAFRVILPFPFHRFFACFHCLFGAFYLPVADSAEIIAVLDGIGDYELLFQFHLFALPVYGNIHFFLDPTAFVINLIKAFFFIQFIYLICGPAITSGKPPSFRRERPFFQVPFEFLH